MMRTLRNANGTDDLEGLGENDGNEGDGNPMQQWDGENDETLAEKLWNKPSAKVKWRKQ